MKFAIVLLALVGYAVAQDDGSVRIICSDNTVVQNALFFFGTGLSGCVEQPFGQYIGYKCKFTGSPQKLYIMFILYEKNQTFAPPLTIHTDVTRFTTESDITDCVTCNMTEYSGLNTNICNAETYWNTEDLEKGSKCLGQPFPSKGNLMYHVYYYKMPLNKNRVQAGSKIKVDVKVRQGPIVCSTLVELLKP